LNDVPSNISRACWQSFTLSRNSTVESQAYAN